MIRGLGAVNSLSLFSNFKWARAGGLLIGTVGANECA